MPIDQAFWTKLATKHGVSEDQARAIASNEGLLGELNEMALRRDDYKTLRDQNDTERASLEQAKQESLAAYQQNLEWYGKKKADLMLVDQYRERYGELTEDGNGRQPILTPSLTQDQVKSQILAAQREMYTLNKEVLKADREYQRQFGKPLPLEELEQVSMKPENAGRNLRDVFTDWVAPQLEQKRVDEKVAEIKTAREEAFKEGLAKGRMREPSQASSDDSPFYAPQVKKEDRPDDATLKRNFMETYTQTQEAERTSA